MTHKQVIEEIKQKLNNTTAPVNLVIIELQKEIEKAMTSE